MMELREDIGPLRRRTVVIFLLVFAALGLIHLRLVHLQLVHGTQWRNLAENNRLRRLPLPGPRGWIYDRRGEVLAENLPSWELLLFPDEAVNLDQTGLFLAREGIAETTTFRELLAERRTGRQAPLVVGENLTWNQVAAVHSHQGDHPELSVVSRFRRHFPFSELTAHAVGHLRPISKAQVAENPDLEPDLMVGATGIEAHKEAFLAGTSGQRWMMVSAVGRQLGVVRETLPTTGHDLGSALDVRLQQAAAAAMGERAGGVVALDPRNGAVRVLYSSPSFDPAVFGGRLSRADWQTLQEDPDHPLQNRCLQGVYPPGSTIKPFLALGGLSEGLIDAHTTVYCNGSIVLYGHRFHCWRRGGHGFVDLERALAESCDVYFYLLGQRLGIEGIARWLQLFGFGEKTGLDPQFESAGLIGTPEWSRRVRKTPWYPGEAVSVSIGQGPLLVTVVQLASAFAMLANGGHPVVPNLVPENAESPTPPEIDPSYLHLVNAALAEVVHGERGTARRLGALPMAGKTGTAQVARLQEGVEPDELESHLRHHAWFVGWAPLDEPEIVVAVIVEHGGDGSRAAAPVAGQVVEAYLSIGQDEPANIEGEDQEVTFEPAPSTGGG
ncbi:MAG: penicillin-binding protein 2 [Acidobacteriota bacterium]|nr:penicillin-binding protein 2 [Acidobacteriota bacterium]